MSISYWILSSVALAVSLHAPTAVSSRPSLTDHARLAEHVVVARVMDVNARYETNAYGDQLIVSHARLHVEESLKGRQEPSLEVGVLGGTVGDMTLEVSNLPRIFRGDRAVFFLSTDNRTGTLVPSQMGQGILKLDGADRVKGTSIDLTAIRRIVASVAGH